MLRYRFFVSVILCVLICASCSKYRKLLKGTDNEAKYQAALEYYEKKNYDRALQLFDVMQAYYRTKPEGETVSYLTAECYFHKKELFQKFQQKHYFQHNLQRLQLLLGIEHQWLLKWSVRDF